MIDSGTSPPLPVQSTGLGSPPLCQPLSSAVVAVATEAAAAAAPATHDGSAALQLSYSTARA